MSGDTNSMVFDLPKNSKGEVVSYNAFTINMDVYQENWLTSVKDKLVVGVPSGFTAEWTNESGAGEYKCTIPITNNGTAEIYRGNIVVYYWKGENVIGIDSKSLNGIVGKETTNLDVWWYANANNGYVVPDGVTVDYNYSNIRNMP